MPDHRHLTVPLSMHKGLALSPATAAERCRFPLHFTSHLLVPYRVLNTVAALDAYIWATDSS